MRPGTYEENDENFDLDEDELNMELKFDDYDTAQKKE